MRDRAATSLMLAEAIAHRARRTGRRAAVAWWRWVTTPRPNAWADEPQAVTVPPVLFEDVMRDAMRHAPVTVRLDRGSVVLCVHLEGVHVILSPGDARRLGRSLVAAAEELEVVS